MLPAAASLKKQGANKGATAAFLIATPESGVDSITVTYALLDPIMTVVRPIAAFMTAMAAGCIENTLNWPPPRKNHLSLKMYIPASEEGESDLQAQGFLRKVRMGLRYGVVDVWGDIAFWFFIGLVIAGIITALVPDDIMAYWLGGGIFSMLVMLVFGIPLYICATASTPVAAALILKGVSPGAALVFLLAGPVTNITSLSVLIGILGKKSVARYMLIIAVMAVLFGLAVDYIYSTLELSPVAVIGGAAEALPYTVKLVSLIVLLLLSVNLIFLHLKKYFVK